MDKRILFQINKLTFLCLSVILLISCTPPRVAWNKRKPTISPVETKKPPSKKELAAKINPSYDIWENRYYRPRASLPKNPYQNEGSLWSSNESWGSLFRDNRARFKGDLVLIKNIASLLVTKLSTGEITGLAKEIDAVQSHIEQMSGEVSKVLPNGVLALYAQKINFKDNASIRYVTTLKGYARLSDITASNEIDAARLVRTEFKTIKGYKINSLNNLEETSVKNKGGLENLESLKNVDQAPPNDYSAPSNNIANSPGQAPAQQPVQQPAPQRAPQPAQPATQPPAAQNPASNQPTVANPPTRANNENNSP
ncbi:MAG: hypothetical protein JJV97_00305 [SAR324 cluster bacterium]|nr:hypothetical protein [SAR324 cluster bacterium]